MVRDQGHLPGLTLFVTMTSPIIHTLLLPDVWQNSVRTEKGRKKLGPQLQGKHSFQPLKPTLQYGGGEFLGNQVMSKQVFWDYTQNSGFAHRWFW